MNIVKLKKPSECNFYGLTIGTLLAISSTPLIAADDDLFFDMPMVLSSNRLEQPVSDAAVSITVIDRETIEASGARTIPEVLRLVPGMQVGYSGNEFGDEPKYVVTYHGHSDQYSKQMQVLVDGRSIYEPFFGGINWKAVPVNIDDIERIEVSRGPNIATYGSNAFMAAINIITRTAGEDQGSYIRSNVGNHDIADLTYRFGGTNGDLDYRITASTLNDDGMDSANQFNYTDDTNSNNIDYRLDYQLDNRNTISYQGGYGNNKQQTDSNQISDEDIPSRRTVDNIQFFQFIKWENSIDTNNTLQLQYYYNLSDKEDRYSSNEISDPDLGFTPFTLHLNGDIKAERHNLELTHFMQPEENLKLVLGASAQFDFVQSSLFLGTDEKITHEQYRAFANIEYRINNSNTINLGALLEKNNFSDTALSPRISFIHAFNSNHKVRFGISQAIRSPFVFEALGSQTYRQELSGGVLDGLTLRENVIGSTYYRSENLDNEKITSREIVYLGEFMNSSLHFNARLFHDDVSNYIDAVKDENDDNFEPNEIPFDTDVHVFRNQISSSTTGLELELDYYIDPSLRLIASGAIVNINSSSDAISQSAPQHSFSLLASKKFNEKYNGSLGYYFVEAFKWTDATPRAVSGGTTPSSNISTEEYQTLDLRASRNFVTNKTKGSLSIVLKNLLDDYSDYQAAPRGDSAPIVIQNTLWYIDFRLNF
jgi:iron complex outermembrane receptor protein